MPSHAAVTRVPPALVVPVVATVTAGLALARRQPLSWDEAVTVAVASRPVPAIVGTLRHSDAVLGAYYLLAHGWGSALVALGLRPTELWWRLPSALAAVVTCVLVASCARRLAGPVAAVLAGTSLAVMPLFAFYTVDARPYTLAAAVVTLAWWTWTRPGPNRPLRRATVTALLLALGAWLQLFTVLVWPAFLLVGGRSAVRRSTATLAAAAVAVVPLLVVALGQSREIAWVPPASFPNTVSVALHIGGGIGVVLALVAVVAFAVGSGRVGRGPVTAAVGWWSVAPLVLLAALDLVRPVLVARYALVSLPLVAVGLGVVVARSARTRGGLALRTAGVVTLVLAVGTSTWQGTRPWKYEDYRGAAAYATRTVAAGTPVLFAPSSARLGVDPYLPAGRLRDVALPDGVGADPLAIAETGPAVLRRALAGACTVVVIGNPVTVGAPTGADAAELDPVAGWNRTPGQRFGQVSVTVLHSPACDSPAGTRFLHVRPRRSDVADDGRSRHAPAPLWSSSCPQTPVCRRSTPPSPARSRRSPPCSGSSRC